MGLYLFQAGFTAECWAEQIEQKTLHLDDLDAKVAQFGGKTVGTWLTFGEYDMVKLLEMPDNATMAAFVLSATSGGHFSAGKTTVLLSTDEGLAALGQANANADG